MSAKGRLLSRLQKGAHWRQKKPRSCFSGCSASSVVTPVPPPVVPSVSPTQWRLVSSSREHCDPKPPQLPFSTRILLVSTATTVCTPFFACAGAGILWHRYLPTTAAGRVAKAALGTCGVFGAFTFLTKYVGPMLYSNPGVVFPFALANGLTAGIWYGLLENRFSSTNTTSNTRVTAPTSSFVDQALENRTSDYVKQVVRRNLLGGAVGALTAASAFLLYPSALDLLLHEEMHRFLFPFNNSAVIADLYAYLVVPVGLPCGAVSGVALQEILYATGRFDFDGSGLLKSGAKAKFDGRETRFVSEIAAPWVVAVSCLAGAAYYFKSTPPQNLMWVARLDRGTGLLASEAIGDASSNVGPPAAGQKTRVADDGRLAEDSAQKRALLGVVRVATSAPAWFPSLFDGAVGGIGESSGTNAFFRHIVVRPPARRSKEAADEQRPEGAAAGDADFGEKMRALRRFENIDAYQRLIALVDAIDRLAVQQKKLQASQETVSEKELKFLQDYAMQFDLEGSELAFVSLTRILSEIDLPCFEDGMVKNSRLAVLRKRVLDKAGRGREEPRREKGKLGQMTALELLMAHFDLIRETSLVN